MRSRTRTARMVLTVVLVGGAVLAAAVGPALQAGAASGSVPSAANPAIRLVPDSGPPGTELTVRGKNFWPPQCKLGARCAYYLALQFTDAAGVVTSWPDPAVDWNHGTFVASDTIPPGAAAGRGVVAGTVMECIFFGCIPISRGSRTFTVTGSDLVWSGTRTGPVPSEVECQTPPGLDRNKLLDCPGDSSGATLEPSIAVDPTDPTHMVVGAIDVPNGVCCNVESYVTFDGGSTWASQDVPFEPSHNFAADPSVAFDSKHGTVLLASNNYELDPGPCNGDLVVAISHDGGVTWEGPIQVGAGHGCLGVEPAVAHDKPWIVADNHPASPHYGRVYVTSLRGTCSEPDCDATLGHAELPIVEAHSDDGGSTWTAPTVISGSNATFCSAYPIAPACSLDPGSWPAVAPDGSVHVAYVNYQHEAAWEPGECCEPQFMVVNSTDGGTTWSDPIHVVDLEAGSRDLPNCAPGSGLPFCDLSKTAFQLMAFGDLVASPVDGTLSLVFYDNRDGAHDTGDPVSNTDVFVMTSHDGGTAWTGPDTVTDAPGDQWFPFADVNPSTGELGVTFYSRSSSSAQVFNVMLATGLPGSFVSTQISTSPSHLRDNLWLPAGVPGCEKCASFIGDYITVAYGSDGNANLAWTDLRRHVTVPGVGSGYTQNIFYSKV